MRRLTLTGRELEGFDPGLPAASVRLLLPQPGSGAPVIPTWDGNEFLHADGARPAIRTLTPLRFDAEQLELDVEVVLHGDGPLSSWAAAAGPGDHVAVAGTGRGYEIDPSAPAFLLAGDESALPAMTMLVAELPAPAEVHAIVELGDPRAEVDLPHHPHLSVDWRVADRGGRPGDELVAAVTGRAIDADTRVWVAGEAASVHRIRRHLFDQLGLPRSRVVVRGYWKHGRRSDGGE